MKYSHRRMELHLDALETMLRAVPDGGPEQTLDVDYLRAVKAIAGAHLRILADMTSTVDKSLRALERKS